MCLVGAAAQKPQVEPAVEGHVTSEDNIKGSLHHLGEVVAGELPIVHGEGQQEEVQGAALHQNTGVLQGTAQRLHLPTEKMSPK